MTCKGRVDRRRPGGMQTDVQEGQGGWPRGHRQSSGHRMFENNEQWLG